MSKVAIIVAAGSARRFGGDKPKQFVEVGGKPILAWTIGQFEKADSVDQICLVVAEDSLTFVQEQIVDRFRFNKVIKIVSGGATRQESVRNGLNALPQSTDLVAIHDGARPLVNPKDIDAVIARAKDGGAAMLATPATDTLKRVEDGLIIATLRRETVYQAQTPQVFETDLILRAYEAKFDKNATDDAGLVEQLGGTIAVVEPTSPNPKITTRADLRIAEILLTEEPDA